MAKTHKINAENKVLGRLAVEIANLLRGKGKPEFEYHLDRGDKVVVVNTDKVVVTGKKKENKMYYRHTGYPGGIKETPFRKAMAQDSREVVRRAVYHMLPKNKLRRQFMEKLTLYRGEEE